MCFWFRSIYSFIFFPLSHSDEKEMTIYKLYVGLCYILVDTHRFAFRKASLEMTVESKKKKKQFFTKQESNARNEK